jgi:hypothetical protein
LGSEEEGSRGSFAGHHEACEESKEEAHQPRRSEAHCRGRQAALGGEEGCCRDTRKVAATLNSHITGAIAAIRKTAKLCFEAVVET